MSGRKPGIVALIGATLGLGLAVATAQGGVVATTADLSIDKTDSANSVAEGTEFSYTLQVANAGPDTASAVTVTDTLPNQLDFVAVTTTQGSCDQQARKVTCELGSLANGASATVTIRVKPTKTGQITNTATVESADNDPQAANNSDSEQTTVTSAPPQYTETCAGKAVDIVGTTGNDTIVGTTGNDVILALGGSDVIDALGGNDLICGNGGVDKIKGRGGNDTARGGGGNDKVRGGNGGDALRGGTGDDRLNGGRGGDALRGGPGNDICRGGPGKDTKRGC